MADAVPHTKNRRLTPGFLAPVLLCLVGVLLSGVAAYFQHQSIDKAAKDEFERMSLRTEAEITGRLEQVLHALRGTRGLYAASQRVDRYEFSRFILSRDMNQEFPGVRGIGFIQRVERADLDAFVAAERADAAPQFAIRQLADKDRTDLFVIKLIEPAVNNVGALGLDVGSEALRRTGIQQAINSGEATTTGAITLVQDDQKLPGVLLYLPVYRQDTPIGTPQERRAALVGVLYAPIVMTEILQNMPDVQSGLLDFEIVGTPIIATGGVVMFDADGHLGGHLLPGADPASGRRLSLRKPLQLPGHSATLIMSSTPVFDASINVTFPWLLFGGGALISALLAAMLHQQATARRRAEAMAGRMTQQLRQDEARWHDFSRSGSDWFWETDEKHRFCYFSENFEAAYGLAPGKLLGKNRKEILGIDALNAPEVIAAHLSDLVANLSFKGYEYQIRGDDGAARWISVSGLPHFDAQGQFAGYRGTGTLITERKLIEVQLHAAMEDAQAASMSKSQFLANMSHELRTPMNAILGMLTLLRKTELTTRQADYAAKSDGAARSLLRLLNEILDFSKIEAGKMTLDPQPFAVDQLLRDLSVILSTSVGEKPVEILFDIDPLLPRQLVGDAMRLQQVLLNLGSNAIKFTAKGEVVLSIEVMLCTDDVVTVRFSMADSGIGIAPENQARIFSGFTQAEASTTRRFGGTGLGVAISQRFVSLMGGELELDSELGIGSHFYFTVTLPIGAENDVQQHQSLLKHAETTSWHTLVIDDNHSAREVQKHIGQSLGWNVDLAESGEQALQMLQQRTAQGIHYQAIFVDASMPGMDGWQTSQHIRAQQTAQLKAGDSHHVPVVVMVSAHERELLSQHSPAELALLDGILVKPVTASMLFDAVIDARNSHDYPHPSRINAPTAQRRLDGMRLLLVEDNLINQQVALELLEQEGALVQVANHGQEAVAAIVAADPAFDVVLMDLQMPVMDGFAATNIIRNDLGLTTLPIVAMTANAQASDREACLAAGMNHHVGKPFDINKLVLVLRGQAQWDNDLQASVDAEHTRSLGVEEAATSAGVDLTAALHRLGGNQALYGRILATFVQDLQVIPEQLQGFVQNLPSEGTTTDAKRVLHTLKGLAATLGAMTLSSTVGAAEKTIAASPGAEQAVASINQTCTAIHSALPGLQALLAALQQEHASDNAAEGRALHAQHSLDRPALLTALGDMIELLRADDLEAMNAMAELQQQFGEALGEEMAALAVAMADLEFDRALPLCQELLDSHVLHGENT